jgi:hypothetical protein
MAVRIKKPAIKPEQRLDWLRRCDDGESPPKIAENDKVDVRTVRKHIELAKQEREAKEARSVVLRNALELHYRDLCDCARKLGGLPPEETTGTWTPYSEYMRIALRQHLPRSPIWGYLNQRDSLQQRIAQLTEEAVKKIEEGVKSDSRLSTRLTDTELGPIYGIIDALKFQIKRWAMGERGGLNIEENLISERAEEGFVNLHYGAFQLGKVAESRLQTVREVIRGVLQDWESRIKQFDEYQKLEKSFLELRRVEKNLNDEIAVITLRRVVPGRCRYCPL